MTTKENTSLPGRPAPAREREGLDEVPGPAPRSRCAGVSAGCAARASLLTGSSNASNRKYREEIQRVSDQIIRAEVVDDNAEIHAFEFDLEKMRSVDVLQEQELDCLVAEIALIRRIAGPLQSRLELVQTEVQFRMEQHGATEHVAPAGTVTLKPRAAHYDQDRLDALLELLDEGELVGSDALVPEHIEEQTVPRKYNVTKLKRFAKRGHAIARIIEGARRVPGYIFKFDEAS